MLGNGWQFTIGSIRVKWILQRLGRSRASEAPISDTLATGELAPARRMPGGHPTTVRDAANVKRALVPTDSGKDSSALGALGD